jgi:hypothetical protein
MILGSRKPKTTLAAAAETVRTEVDNVLGTLAGKVTEAREKVATLSDDGARAARKALDTAVKDTRKAAKALDKKWKAMDNRQKAVVVGGLLAAVAAAIAAPTIARKVRGTKKKRR